MKRITFSCLAGFTFLTVLVATGFAPQAIAQTPNPNSAVVKTRIFNDCPFTTINVVNNYPSLVSIEDVGLACSGFANLHNWSFSTDGTGAASFPNNSDFRVSCDLVISGTGNGESGIRVSPWYSQDVDGRFNVRVPDGEIACFGGRLPFFSFTAAYGLHYQKGDPIHLELTVKPHGLNGSSPGTIEYGLVYQGTTYSSGELNLDSGNPAEDPPHGLWGILNDANVGGYFQAFMQPGNFGSTAKATFTNIQLVICPIEPDPVTASVKTRVFNDCPFTTLNVVNNYPSLISYEDIGLACSGFANLHVWTMSDGGHETVINNDEDFRIATDLVITGRGEGGLRVSPWYSHDVDGLFNVRSTDGEIACFGGRLPFYSFSGAPHNLRYRMGDPIRLEVIYKHNGLSMASPGTIQYSLAYLGTSYTSGPLNFDEANPSEDPPRGRWGILNDARAGGHMKAFMTPGDFTATTKASFSNITFAAGPEVGLDIEPGTLKLNVHGRKVTAYIEPAAPNSAADIDVSTLRLNGIAGVDPAGPVTVGDHDGDGISDLAVRFSRRAVLEAAVASGGLLSVTGAVGGTCFAASDQIRFHRVGAPAAGSVLAAGSVVSVSWTPPEGVVGTAAIYWSGDGGETWTLVADGVPNSGSYGWTVPNEATTTARIAVEVDDGTPDGSVGISGMFSIQTPVGVGEPGAVEFALRGVTPNPSKFGVNVAFSLANADRATLSLYDVTGRRLAFREVGGMGAGRHTVTLAERLPAGMYMVRLSQGGRSLTTSAAVVR